jgi:hypothetical protein
MQAGDAAPGLIVHRGEGPTKDDFPVGLDGDGKNWLIRTKSQVECRGAFHGAIGIQPCEASAWLAVD